MNALAARYDDALLYRRLATIEYDAPTVLGVDELAWSGPRPAYRAALAAIDGESYVKRIDRLVRKRG